MSITLGFLFGVLAGAWMVRRTIRKAQPPMKRGLTRHTFHVDLPKDEMPELAVREYYEPRHHKRVRI